MASTDAQPPQPPAVSDPTLGALITETRNAATEHLDELDTLRLLTAINLEDQTVALAVERELPAIARAVDAIVERVNRGGRVFYLGAGTSGRLGVLDASECPPTFSVAPDLFQGIIAGGDSALRLSSEHAEDSPEQGAADLAAHGFGRASNIETNPHPHTQPEIQPKTHPSPDILVGIAASGRTPYVLGGIRHARSLGCLTIALACVPGSAIAAAAEIAITPVTGPEALTGSTRMKAGTATKLVLNMLSTAVMVRTGAVYSNLMVNVRPTNAKLIDRAERILIAITGCDRATARRLIEETGDVKTAALMQHFQLSRDTASERLLAANGNLRRAMLV